MKLEEIYGIYPHLQLIEQLPAMKRVAFAAACCEHLTPNYSAFCLMERWGNPAILDDALSFTWKSLTAQEIDLEELARLMSKCEHASPDTDDFGSLFVGSATDAAGAVYYALNSLQDRTAESAVTVGWSAIRTIESYLFRVNVAELSPHAADVLLHRWLYQAPLLKLELRFQEEIISKLARPDIDLIGERIQDELRRTASHSGIQPFKRGIVTMNA